MKELPTAATGPETQGTQQPPEPPKVSSARLMTTLAIAGALAGLVIVLVFEWADPQIQAHRAAALRAAVLEVLDGPASYQSLFVTSDGLSEIAPAGVDTVTAEKVFLGFDESGAPVGYAVTGAEPGFQDFIHLIFGFDAAGGRVLGMKVLESKETPGLGDKIFKDSSFVRAFRGVDTPILGVKAGAGTGAGNEIDMITGATISSRTVIGTVNHRIEALGSVLAEHAATEPRAAPTESEPVVSEQARALSEGGEEGS